MPRIFVAVPVAAPVRAALSRLRRHPAPGLRWVAEHQFHITLKFLGDTSEADVETVRRAAERAALSESAAGASSPPGPSGLELAARSVGAFPNARSVRVVWAGVTGDTARLSGLQRALDEYLTLAGFEPEARPFKPHITIARARRPEPLPEALRQYADCEFGRWRADAVEIVESRLTPAGPIYTVRHRVPIGS